MQSYCILYHPLAVVSRVNFHTLKCYTIYLLLWRVLAFFTKDYSDLNILPSDVPSVAQRYSQHKVRDFFELNHLIELFFMLKKLFVRPYQLSAIYTLFLNIFLWFDYYPRMPATDNLIRTPRSDWVVFLFSFTCLQPFIANFSNLNYFFINFYSHFIVQKN